MEKRFLSKNLSMASRRPKRLLSKTFPTPDSRCFPEPTSIKFLPRTKTETCPKRHNRSPASSKIIRAFPPAAVAGLRYGFALYSRRSSAKPSFKNASRKRFRTLRAAPANAIGDVKRQDVTKEIPLAIKRIIGEGKFSGNHNKRPKPAKHF